MHIVYNTHGLRKRLLLYAVSSLLNGPLGIYTNFDSEWVYTTHAA